MADAFAAGYALGAANYLLLVRQVRGLAGGTMYVALVMASQFRLFATGVVLYVLLAKLEMNVLGVLLGLSIMVASIPVVWLYTIARGKKEWN